MEGKKNRSTFFLIMLMAVVCLASGCKHRRKNGKWTIVDENTIFIDSVRAQKYLVDEADQREFGKEIANFYTTNNFLMAWDDFEQPGGLAEKFIDKLSTCYDDGLDSTDFRINKLRQLMARAQVAVLKDSAVKELDVLLTTEFIRYAAQMRDGITRNRRTEYGGVISSAQIPHDSFLKIAIASVDSADPFQILSPPHPEYGKLRTALRFYRELDKRCNGNGIPGLGADGNCDTSESLLKFWDDLSVLPCCDPWKANFFYPTMFGHTLDKAYNDFESRGETSNANGEETYRATKMSAGERVKQILVNMERWRLVPGFESRYLLVNVPEFELHVYDANQEAFKMKVIVGKEYKSTPVFNDNLKNIVFSPYWNIPNSITGSEVLHEIEKNPAYLEQHHMEAVDGYDTGAHRLPFGQINWRHIDDPDFHYRIRQRPGNDNPLGLVKFIFPNTFNVYLHGTNSPGLFNKTVRAYSHGCIRIEYPVKLAQFLLKDQPQWTEADIDSAMNGGHEKWVAVKGTPVHIVYFTAWVDATGKMQFRDDIYGLDRAMEQTMGM